MRPQASEPQRSQANPRNKGGGLDSLPQSSQPEAACGHLDLDLGLRPPGCDYGWVSAPSSVLQDPSTHPRAGLAAPGGARAPPPKRARPASVEAPWALLAGLPLHLQSGFLWAPRPLRPGSAANATLCPLAEALTPSGRTVRERHTRQTFAAREYGTLGRATRGPQEWVPVTAQPGPGCRWGLALAGAQGLPRSRLVLAIEDGKPGQGELRDASQAR